VRRLPPRAGIYLIHRRAGTTSHELYVGQAVDVRRQLAYGHDKIREWGWGDEGISFIEVRRQLAYGHDKIREWGWGDEGISFIEVLSVKAPAGGPGWCLVDLDDAEEQHIRRARKRASEGGPQVANKTLGRNGYKSLTHPTHVLIWSSEPLDTT